MNMAGVQQGASMVKPTAGAAAVLNNVGTVAIAGEPPLEKRCSRFRPPQPQARSNWAATRLSIS